MQQLRIAAVLPLLALGACTTRLQLDSILPLDDNPQTAATIPAGLPYPLYYDRFNVETIFTVVNCSPFKIEVAAEIKEVVAEADPLQTYRIDPSSLSGPLKTSEVEVSYNADGSIAAINAKADDRTAETVIGLAKAAAGIVKIAAAAGGGDSKAVVNCSPATQTAFDLHQGQTKILETAKTNLETAQADFEAVKAKVDASAGIIPAALQTSYHNAYLALQNATERLASAKRRLQALAKPISLTTNRMWPADGSTFTGTFGAPPQLGEKLGLWADRSTDVNPASYAIRIALNAAETGPLVAKSQAPRLSRAALAKGLPYRSPVRGTVSITSAFLDGSGAELPPEMLFEKDYRVRQLGRIMQLPCISRPFTSISCSLAFNDKGQLTKGGSTSTKVAGEVVANMLGGVVDSAGTAAGTLRSAAEARRGAAKKEKEEELAMLELEGKLAAARKALVITPPTDLKIKQDEILNLETDLKLIQARQALAEALATISN